MLIFSVVIFVFSTLTLSPVHLCLEKWGVMTPSSYGSAAPADWCISDALPDRTRGQQTRSHSLKYTQFMVCRSLDAWQLNRRLK